MVALNALFTWAEAKHFILKRQVQLFPPAALAFRKHHSFFSGKNFIASCNELEQLSGMPSKKPDRVAFEDTKGFFLRYLALKAKAGKLEGDAEKVADADQWIEEITALHPVYFSEENRAIRRVARAMGRRTVKAHAEAAR